MTTKKTLQVSEILADFKQGFTDEELMSKYGLTKGELDYALDQMVVNKQLDQSELQAHRALEAGLLEIPEHLPAQYGKKAVWGIVIGLIFSIVGTVIGVNSKLEMVSALAYLVGIVAFIWGCCYLAKSKGYHGALGLLGILGCIGLVILLLIPNKFKGIDSATSTVLIIVVALVALIFILGIILAIAIPYYISYKRTALDRAAHADVLKLGAAIERLGNETIDANGDWATLCKKIDSTNIKWLTGSYYSFNGTNQKAGVRIFIDTNNNEVRGFALRGSRPAGQQSRYVYRLSLCSAKELPMERSTEDFSEYFPISGTCYTSSMVAGSGSQATFIKPEGSLPCSELLKKE